eukprot:3198363-Prymnesium_polylepis.1
MPVATVSCDDGFKRDLTYSTRPPAAFAWSGSCLGARIASLNAIERVGSCKTPSTSELVLWAPAQSGSGAPGGRKSESRPNSKI